MLKRRCYTVDEFCFMHCITRRQFAAMLKKGTAPRLMQVGDQQLISSEAAYAWRQRMTIPK